MMIWIDYAIIGVIMISTIISIMRGFVSEILALFGWLFSLWVAFSFFSPLSFLLVDTIETPILRSITAFAGLFVVTLVISALITRFISMLVMKTGLSGTDRSLGVVFGIIRGGIIITLAVLLGLILELSTTQWWRQSLLIPYFEQAALWTQQFLPESITK